LVDCATQVIESIWPAPPPAAANVKLLPLRLFVQEVLRRSRTSYVTLQTALFYLTRVQKLHERCDVRRPCGRRMFLASLVIATKYLQDRAYSNRAWSRVSGLSASEITRCERKLLQWLSWNLYIQEKEF
ncbi:cyclin-domain-containing protein, partial [Thamnocephalis sphaerospora]